MCKLQLLITTYYCQIIDFRNKKLHTRKYFYEKSRDHIHDVIYRPQLSRGILNIRFQLTPCRETCT